MTLLGRAKAKPDRNRVWGDEAAAEDPQRKEALGLKLQQFSATQQRVLGAPGRKELKLQRKVLCVHGSLLMQRQRSVRCLILPIILLMEAVFQSAGFETPRTIQLAAQSVNVQCPFCHAGHVAEIA